MTVAGQARRRFVVAVVGDARVEAGGAAEVLAQEIGTAIVDAGYRLVTGGLGGVMEAAHRGARQSARWSDGAGIGLLPGHDPAQANPYVDIAIPTGLDHGRNMLVAQADAVVAVGGGAGTLSEIALAWIHKRLIVGMRCGGWSARLADQRVDGRVRYPQLPEDRVYGADSAAQVGALLARWLPLYSARDGRIVTPAGGSTPGEPDSSRR